MHQSLLILALQEASARQDVQSGFSIADEFAWIRCGPGASQHLLQRFLSDVCADNGCSEGLCTHRGHPGSQKEMLRNAARADAVLTLCHRVAFFRGEGLEMVGGTRGAGQKSGSCATAAEPQYRDVSQALPSSSDSSLSKSFCFPWVGCAYCAGLSDMWSIFLSHLGPLCFLHGSRQDGMDFFCNMLWRPGDEPGSGPSKVQLRLV